MVQGTDAVKVFQMPIWDQIIEILIELRQGLLYLRRKRIPRNKA
jgi:hypothetical protein